MRPAFPDLRPAKPIDWDEGVRRERARQAAARSDNRMALMHQADERAERALAAAASEVYRLRLTNRDVMDERDEARELINLYLSQRATRKREWRTAAASAVCALAGILGLAAAVTGLLVLWVQSGGSISGL